MERLQLFIGLSLYLAVSVDSYICPVMEGDSITLMCTLPYSSSSSSSSSSTNKLLFWNREVDNNHVVVITCDIENNRCRPSNSHYTSSLTSVNTSSATSILTISSAERIDQGSWICSNPSLNIDVAVCDVKVFAKPISVSCGQPELQNDSVRVTCTGEKVYPEPLCLFSWIRNGTEVASDQAVVNQSLYEQGSPSYFSSRCTWTVPVQSLGFGSHQFKVLMYPNVTGTNDDRNYGTSSNLTSPVKITIPDVVLEGCPEDFVQEGTTVSCTCKEKNNLFLLADVTWSAGSGAPVVGKQNSDLTFQAARNSPSYSCQAEILDTKSVSILYVPKVAFPPTITSYTVNGSTNLTVHNNTDVMFSCEAEGNPSPDLFLLRDSYSNKLGNTDSNNQVTFKFNKTMTCQDTGVYVCQAQTQKTEKNESVQVNVLCKQQLAASENQNRAYSGRVNESLNIKISVFGYPEPELSLQSSTVLEKNVAYDLKYFSVTPGHGTVSLNMFTLIETYMQKYDLNITNSQGTLVYSFEIIQDLDREAGEDVDVGAIVGGVIAGIVVVMVVIAVFIIRRKGLLRTSRKEKSAKGLEYTVGPYEENEQPLAEYRHFSSSAVPSTFDQTADPDYMNTVQPSSPYNEIVDVQAVTPDLPYMNMSERDVQPHSHYEEVMTAADISSRNITALMKDTQSLSGYVELVDAPLGSPEPSGYVNHGSPGTHTKVVEYENMVPTL